MLAKAEEDPKEADPYDEEEREDEEPLAEIEADPEDPNESREPEPKLSLLSWESRMAASSV